MKNRIKRYPEILELQKFSADNQVSIGRSFASSFDASIIPMELHIGNENCVIQVMDEYKDLELNSDLLNLVLVLRELELLNDSKDYLEWCNQQGIDPNNDKLRDYYITITKTLLEIRSYFPNNEITSFINDLDFQLNAGAIQFLRKQ